MAATSRAASGAVGGCGGCGVARGDGRFAVHNLWSFCLDLSPVVRGFCLHFNVAFSTCACKVGKWPEILNPEVFLREYAAPHASLNIQLEMV